jgi:hypothetical protein
MPPTLALILGLVSAGLGEGGFHTVVQLFGLDNGRADRQDQTFTGAKRGWMAATTHHLASVHRASSRFRLHRCNLVKLAW